MMSPSAARIGTLLVLLFAVVLSQDCSLCNDYDCLESSAQCGPEGYLIKLAKHFCERLTEPELISTFSSKGRKSVFCIRDCLLEQTNWFVNNSTSFPFSRQQCDELQFIAIKFIHQDCYRQCGFCTLSKDDFGEAFFNNLYGKFCCK